MDKATQTLDANSLITSQANRNQKDQEEDQRSSVYITNLLNKMQALYPFFATNYPTELSRTIIGNEYARQCRKHNLTVKQAQNGLENLSDFDNYPKPAEFAKFCKPEKTHACHQDFAEALPAPSVNVDKAESELDKMKAKLNIK